MSDIPLDQHAWHGVPILVCSGMFQREEANVVTLRRDNYRVFDLFALVIILEFKDLASSPCLHSLPCWPCRVPPRYALDIESPAEGRVGTVPQRHHHGST